MLISRRSRKSRGTDSPFKSRFRQAEADFPLRQYLRCRDEFTQRVIQSIVLCGIIVALILFGRTLHHLFERHGALVSPWYERFAIFALALVCLFIARRIWRHLVALIELRTEMRSLRAKIHEPSE